MTHSEEDIERLIVRSLDGELGTDEQLELDRELLRNREARRLMEEYKRIDVLSASALEHALGDDRMPLDPLSLPAHTPVRQAAGDDRRYGRILDSTYAFRWLLPGAVAAALLAIVFARFPLVPSASDPLVADRDRQPVNRAVPAIRPETDASGIMRTIRTGGPRIRRDTGREVLGVVGEDGNIYWIEVDRTLTVRRPKQAVQHSAAEEM